MRLGIYALMLGEEFVNTVTLYHQRVAATIGEPNNLRF